jgi:hypothetical protein
MSGEKQRDNIHSADPKDLLGTASGKRRSYWFISDVLGFGAGKRNYIPLILNAWFAGSEAKRNHDVCSERKPFQEIDNTFRSMESGTYLLQ